MVYGDMLCTIGDERRLFMSLLYAGVVLCFLEILDLLEVFGFPQPRSFLLEGWERPWSDGSGLARSREGRRRETLATRLSSLAVLCLLEVPGIF